MKTFTILSILILFSIKPSFSQSICRSQLLNYTGPHNTSELTTKLNVSNHPLILTLSSSIKQKLISYTVFDNGYPRGLDSTDGIMTAFMQSGSAAAILSAIFNCPVGMYSYATKPVFSTISLSAFMTLYNSNPTQYAFVPFISTCYNCYYGKNDVCCYVGGNGCYDIAIEFINTGEHFYVIQD